MSKLSQCVDILDSQRIPLSGAQRASLAKIYPYYGAQGVIDYVDNYIFDGDYILVAEDGNNLKSLNENIATWASGKFWVNNHAHILGAKQGFNLKYIYYLLNCMDLRGYITGSAQPKLNQENLANVEINVPDEKLQNKISNILSVLDSKISNNNAINAELEAMAKTIYDYWFLQFEFPDENGKPYKSSGGKMVYNEELKREIPEGWGAETLGDVLRKQNLSISSDQAHAYPYTPMDTLPCKRMSFGACKSGEEANSSLLKYDKYDVLFGAMRAYFHRVCIAPYQGITRTTTFVLRPAIPNTLGYSYETINAESSVAYAVTHSIGTQQPYAVWENSLEKMIIPAAPTDLKTRYSSTIANTIEKVIANELENQELASLRDFLLPLLMNGQVGFKDSPTHE